VSQPYPRARINREPPWKPVHQFTAAKLPQQLRYWLLDDGSLTNHLIESSRGQFKVQRLYQGWQVPLASERALLELPQRSLALIREVTLMNNDQAVVFARSVFPQSFLRGRYNHLRRLQSRPLGAILFKHPHMHRSPFELANISGTSEYLPDALHQPKPAWGRRSRFIIDGKSVMVSEVFLRAFKPWPKMAQVHRAGRGKVSALKETAKHSTCQQPTRAD
jgi:chorismate--pyruvate lyase